MEYVVRIIDIQIVTHDVKCFRFEKPSGYRFNPGQATDVSINKPDWREERRPFTFTCLNEDPFLEFTIKRYPQDHGVTDLLHQLHPGDELIIRDVWGAIEYRGPGYFIAGGAGITPFLAILRQLHKDGQAAGNVLYFSNRTAADIILETELRTILKDDVIFILSREEKAGYVHGHIDSDFLKQRVKDFHRPFYICGPDPMISGISGLLTDLGASPETLVFEK